MYCEFAIRNNSNANCTQQKKNRRSKKSKQTLNNANNRLMPVVLLVNDWANAMKIFKSIQTNRSNQAEIPRPSESDFNSITIRIRIRCYYSPRP